MTPAESGLDILARALTRIKERLDAVPFRAMGIDPPTPAEASAMLESLYTAAYRDYTQGRHEQALTSFRLLLLHEPMNQAYLLGASLCLQHLALYADAIRMYQVLRYVEPHRHGHFLAIAECQLLAGDGQQARTTLSQVIHLCRRDDSCPQVRVRAQAMLELMRPQDERAAV